MDQKKCLSFSQSKSGNFNSTTDNDCKLMATCQQQRWHHCTQSPLMTFGLSGLSTPRNAASEAWEWFLEAG